MSWAYTPSEQDDAVSLQVIQRALDLGVTLLDTADAYGPFTNEELVGRALNGCRDEAIVATKCGLVVTDADKHEYAKSARPEYVRAACDASLKRLNTDRIDLYYLHRVDPDVPLEESWGALSELVSAGKVLALGLSEVSVEELARAQAIHPVAALQSELSLWTRDTIDNGALSWCAEHDAAFIPFCPLGRGYLTGTVSTVSDDDFRAHNPRFTDEALAANVAIVERVRNVASRLGATPAQVALAWVLAQGEHVIPIPGTKRLTHLEENAAAAELTLDAREIEELDATPPAVGDRYT